MIKTYKYNYHYGDAYVTFDVDLEKFTEDLALATLNFYSWKWDKKADKIDEVMKKYALQALRYATFNNHNVQGVISDFNEGEGYAPVDGSLGIKLISVEGYEFEESELHIEKQ